MPVCFGEEPTAINWGMSMNKIKNPKYIIVRSVCVFAVVFLIANSFAHLAMLSRKNEAKLKASYTAESTVRRIESQLNKYISKTDVLKNVIENGYKVDDEQFNALAGFMLDENHVIEAVELAKNGVVSQVYPIEGNEEAVGLDFFENESRKYNARIARDSGEYTLAGPFELVQGGTGVLLFDPIYTKNSDGSKNFWGFSLLVINWDNFINELELERLDESEYHYKIWKNDISTGNEIIIAEYKNTEFKEALEVVCDVPNDVWYFDIEPVGGWISKSELAVYSALCLIAAAMIAFIYWQFEKGRYNDKIYAENIKKSADEARAANAAKTSFLARMTHDIRTPLNGIIGLLNIDEKHPDNAELIKANRAKMIVAANHLLSLINDVLQMSKLESGEIILAHEPVNLIELADDINTLMEQRAHDAGVTVEYNRDPNRFKYPYIYGSPLHIRQIFLNIYGNCIKYNKPNGKVETKFSSLGVKDNVVTYKWVISDTGIGMSHEFLKHIFEPFAQEKADEKSINNGTGLGMAIVKELVDKMNGTIEVESTEGEGSTFTIIIPFEIAEKEMFLNKTSLDKNASIKGIKLLLVEDNELNAEIAETLIGDEGAIITAVKDGQQAVDSFKENPPGTYDGILMDVMMPVMDGITATKVIRAMDRADAKTIPIIAMTANAFNEDAARCINAGMNAHLAKPLQMDIVVDTIARYCGKNKTEH